MSLQTPKSTARCIDSPAGKTDSETHETFILSRPLFFNDFINDIIM